jgi:hypothetical protein
MSTFTQTALDSIFAGHITEKQTVPDEKTLREWSASTGHSVDALKDKFAEHWRAAGNLDDPFGRNPNDDEDDEA